jgi:cytochrome c-type biogenesis protein CcmH
MAQGTPSGAPPGATDASVPRTDARLDAAPIEARVRAISSELRCLVCQNQTIADSHADLAVDLRERVREQVIAGASDEAIRQYMVERYGEFVLYRPPIKASTILLWFGPVLFVLTGGLLLVLGQRRRARAGDLPDPDDSLADEADRSPPGAGSSEAFR